MSNMSFASSMLSTSLRAMSGISAQPSQCKPEKLLQLYDKENCPYCRLVREALTELDLDVQIFPCPRNGSRYLDQLVERGGKVLCPYLVDPNTGVEMYESLDILAYLFETYSDEPMPLKWRLGGLQTFGSMLASAPRLRAGMRASTGQLPQQMLELYSFESSPNARLVRELLCELEIPYIVRNCGRAGASDWLLPAMRERLDASSESAIENRRYLQQTEGRVSIPFLFDPNKDFGLFESEDILEYINRNYA